MLVDGRIRGVIPAEVWTSIHPAVYPEFYEMGSRRPKAAELYRATFNASWDRARRVCGMPTFHFHDLRHTGNTLAAGTGASTKELMARMGHASARAALIYQHASEERDVLICRAAVSDDRRGVEKVSTHGAQ
jgi:integrase